MFVRLFVATGHIVALYSAMRGDHILIGDLMKVCTRLSVCLSEGRLISRICVFVCVSVRYACTLQQRQRRSRGGGTRLQPAVVRSLFGLCDYLFWFW